MRRIIHCVFMTVAATLPIVILATACGETSAPGSAAFSATAAMPKVCTRSGPVVFAVSGREDSPAPALTGTMQAAASKAVDTGSAIGVVDVDGHPDLVAASAFIDPSPGNNTALSSDRAAYLGQITHTVDGIRAKHPHANVLQALDVAGRAIRAACARGGTIYLEDSGLQEVGPVNFLQRGSLAGRPVDVVAFLSRQHELPELNGMAVVLIGVGDTAPPQQPLSISQRGNLTAIWSAIVNASGATSIVVDPSPRSGAPPAHVPPVALIPVPAGSVWKPRDGSYVFPDSGPVGFEPNTARFRDSVAAATALRRLADYLIAHPAVKIELSGTTAHWGTLASDIVLARHRADTVKSVLVRFGAASGQIRARGLGWKFPSYENDQGPDGTLLPGPAEHNRSVIVTSFSGPKR